MARLHRANPESGIDHGLARRFLHEMSLIPRFEEKAAEMCDSEGTRCATPRARSTGPVRRWNAKSTVIPSHGLPTVVCTKVC
jgi:hypothetical protein